MRDVADRIRAGDYTEDELAEQEPMFREIVATSAAAESSRGEGRADREVRTMLGASKAAAEDVLDAIAEIRRERGTSS